jgi:hypothetical protein
MKSSHELISYLNKNGELVLFDTLGCQKLISFEKKTQRIYYLEWSPRENTGEPREYISFDTAVSLIKKYKPNLFR